MVRGFAIFASAAILGKVVAEEACDNANVEEASLLQQSKLQNVEVKSHSSTTCAHLVAAELKMAERTKNAANCLSGIAAGKEYCQPGDEVDCPGSPGTTCGIKIGKPCCPNPCVGVPPYGDAATFPCPSTPDQADIQDIDDVNACESDVKKDDCLDPCAPTPPPTPSPPPSPTPPEPTPTPPPTLWVCKESDINFPGFKATAPDPNMACASGATCYGDDISTCKSKATCYATGTIQTCSTGARCCAQKSIALCKIGATCFAKDIGECTKGATCVERPKWGDDDDK